MPLAGPAVELLVGMLPIPCGNVVDWLMVGGAAAAEAAMAPLTLGGSCAAIAAARIEAAAPAVVVVVCGFRRAKAIIVMIKINKMPYKINVWIVEGFVIVCHSVPGGGCKKPCILPSILIASMTPAIFLNRKKIKVCAKVVDSLLTDWPKKPA